MRATYKRIIYLAEHPSDIERYKKTKRFRIELPRQRKKKPTMAAGQYVPQSLITADSPR